MYFYELISAFSLYGGDVIIFAFITTATIQFAKSNILKNVEKKMLTFMPFLIGTVIYAVYTYFTLGTEHLLNDFSTVFEHGIAVGTLATFLYVLYEQFLRKTETTLSLKESLVLALIHAYVKEESAKSVAKNICAEIVGKAENDGVLIIKNLILQNADKDILSDELNSVCNLVYKSLLSLSPSGSAK